ncbi:MAG: Ldh family oxidoreductase [Candidatus Brocadiia bacterium]
MRRVAKDQLLDFAVRYLARKGVTGPRAAYLAEVAVTTEAWGIHTHGLRFVPSWERNIGKDIDPAAEPELAAQKGATALVEGHSSFGPLALRLARETAVPLARRFGVAAVAGRNMSWLGALGPQVVPLSGEGLFAQCWAQDNGCQDCAPWGGLEPCFSTNPLALTFPTPGLPVVSDFSTAALSMGSTRALIRRGEKAPANIYMDKHGNPTSDPTVVDQGGTFFHLGGEHYGYRGYALALCTEAFAALAGGNANNPQEPNRQSFHLLVVDPEAFGHADHYAREVERYVARIKGVRLRPGFTEVRLPGERAQRAAQQAERHGVAIEDYLLDRLNAIAEKYGLPALQAKGDSEDQGT